jgi:hypothetical protein
MTGSRSRMTSAPKTDWQESGDRSWPESSLEVRDKRALLVLANGGGRDLSHPRATVQAGLRRAALPSEPRLGQQWLPGGTG